jgi:hypothetical protein
MLLPIAIALTMLSTPEVPTITLSTLAGAPNQTDRLLKVSCGEKVYSFKFSISQDEISIEFERDPMQPSDKLSAEVIEAFRQFSGAPFLEAWCERGNADNLAGSLWLEATGPLQVNDKEARENCIERGGMFDRNSWRLIVIEDDSIRVDGDEIGKCTTQDDIDEYNRRTRDSVK